MNARAVLTYMILFTAHPLSINLKPYGAYFVKLSQLATVATLAAVREPFHIIIGHVLKFHKRNPSISLSKSHTLYTIQRIAWHPWRCSLLWMYASALDEACSSNVVNITAHKLFTNSWSVKVVTNK